MLESTHISTAMANFCLIAFMYLLSLYRFLSKEFLYASEGINSTDFVF